MTSKPVVLIDGSSYLYRAFHVPNLQALTTSKGEPTGAIHGVLNMVQKLLNEYEPERVAVVFDAPGKTFRHALYDRYKANRPKMPDELRSQIAPLIEAIEALGVKVLRVDDVEADDVIGTLTRRAAQSGYTTVISTMDKDMTQLVDAHTLLVNTMTDTRLDEQGVRDKFGVAPVCIVDFLSLIGDTSDNIPGVEGVGPKTAAKWLAEYGDLDGLAARAGEIGGRAGERLRAALADLPLYRELATIKCDLDIEATPDDLVRAPIDAPRLRELLERLEMRAFLRRVLPESEPDPSEPLVKHDADYDLVLTERALEEWLAKIESAELVALGTASTSADYMRAELVGISVAVAPGEAAYVPLAHRYPGAPEQLDRGTVLARLKPWLESESRGKVGHHVKLGAHVLHNHGIALDGIRHDTMLESYMLNSTATRHDIDSLAARHLGIETVKYEDVAGKGAKQIAFGDVELERAAPYAAESADVTLRLHAALWPELEAAPGPARVYAEIERPLIRVLEKMEYAGVKVDAGMLERQSRTLAEAMLRTEQAAFAAAGGPFNLGSPKQLQEVLYDRLSLPVLGKTPKGQPSTAENVLQDLAEQYELPRRVLEYRALAKLKSTYTDRLPREINARTGRIHTSYHQAVAATGRLSSSDPNLQNIPIRTPEGRRIRQAFVAEPGYTLIAADYSQIELRIMAHLSGDPGLLRAFSEDRDIHQATAAEVFGVALDDVEPEQRRSAKAINFGLIYGMSAFGLGRQLGIPRGEAQAYVDLYFERYPGVKAYMDETRERARRQGYVETVFGRRLYLPDINARNAQRRQYAERSAINAPMQGTAADIIKRAMLAVDAWLTAGAIRGRLIMQVHDELVLEVAEDAAPEVAEATARIMETAATLAAPLRVDAGIGANWDEAH